MYEKTCGWYMNNQDKSLMPPNQLAVVKISIRMVFWLNKNVHSS